MFLRMVLAICLTTLSASAFGNTLKPFTSDGCSSFPNGTFEQRELWLGCCTAHDYAYWQGGSYDDRLQADKALQSCVAKLGKPDVALLMLAGVRLGGTPFFPTSYRWGYGWSYPKFYRELTEDELAQVKARTAEAGIVDK